MSITIYGASDDLIEVEGDVWREFYLSEYGTRLRLTAPDNDSLDVLVDFGTTRVRAGLDWTITVEAIHGYPSWPIRFHERPDREGDPAVTIETPPGTTVENLTEAEH